MLLEAGADLEARDKNHRTPLLSAVANAHGDQVIHLVERGADVNAKIPNSHHEFPGWSVLHFVAPAQNSLPVVRFLVEAGADPHAGDVIGNTPVAGAVQLDRTQVVEYLRNLDEPSRRPESGEDHAAAAPPVLPL